MKQFFSFWLQCAKRAFWGNAAFANDYQWIFGIPLLSGLAVYWAAYTGNAEVGTGNAIFDAFLGALGAFIITWLVAFFVRLLNAPVAALAKITADRDRALDALDQITNSYAHSLRLLKVDADISEPEGSARAITYFCLLKNNCDRTIRYSITALLIDEIEQNNLSAPGLIIPAKQEGSFCLPTITRSWRPEAEALQTKVKLTIEFGPPHESVRKIDWVILIVMNSTHDLKTGSLRFYLEHENETDLPDQLANVPAMERGGCSIKPSRLVKRGKS